MPLQLLYCTLSRDRALQYMVRILDLLVISTKLILIVTFVLRLMTIKESNPKFEKIC